LQIGTNMLLIITSTGDRLFSLIKSMILNDFELPKKVFIEFLAICRCSAHFSTELRRNGWR